MVRIITDTTACLPSVTAQRYGIPVIPQIIHFGTDSFREGVDLDNAAFMQRLKAARTLPKTAAPAPEDFLEVFRHLLPFHETILCIHPSSDLSGTVRSATVAASELPDADIRVIDTRCVAGPLGTMVTLAAEWAAAGQDADQIEASLRSLIPRTRIYFLVATLEYLARGGRIGGAAALLGGILQVKPILTVRDGRVDKLEQERTQRRALARLRELVRKQYPADGSGNLTAMHAGVPEQGQALAEELRAELGLPTVPVLDVPPAIVTHGGPGILGVGFFAKSQ